MARKMKDSGIEWIGEIPEGWSIARGKHILTLLQRTVFPTDGVITCFRDGEVTLRSNRREDGFTVSLKEIGYQGIEPGDLVVHGMDGFAGSIGISDSRGKSSPVLVVLDSSQDKKYLMYYLRSMAYNNVFLALSTGIRVRSCDLKWNKLADLLYLVPPIVEQHKLVSFLDEKCSEIDTMLSKTRSSIEEYKKLKQAVISQAVTKGVRGERETKDSGVEWIGAIPKDWEIKRLKSFCTIVDCKNRTPDVFPDGKYTVVRTTCIKDCSFSYEGSYQTDTTNFKAWTLKGQPHKGDIFFTREAPVGEACLVPNADNLCMGQRVMFFRPEDNSDARYIMYSIYGPLVREYIASKNSGSTVGHLKLGQVACIPIFYCPPLEQKEIADYLDAKCAEIDRLIAKKEQLVKELESYKKSLIYEVVTGKREV